MLSAKKLGLGGVLAVSLLAIFSGCATTGSNGAAGAGAVLDETMRVPSAELGQTASAPEISPALAAENARAALLARDAFKDYRIGPGDVLGFRLFDDDSLNTQVTVRHDGKISLPWIPDVSVGGLTRMEATDLLTEAYGELYLDTEASLVITEARSKSFSVMGDVMRPARYPYDRPMTLLDGLNSAGGLRINQRGGDSYVGAQGQLVKALIIRHDAEGKRIVAEVDLRNFEEPGAHVADTPILPDDVIFVPEGINLVYLLGAVSRPQPYPLREDMTLLQLLATAGGLPEPVARMRHVVIIREVADGETEVMMVNVRAMLKTGAPFFVQAGDVIYVPRKRLTNLSEFLGRLYSPAQQTMSISSQVMSLYQQLWSAWFTEDRYDALYGNQQRDAVETLRLLEGVQDLSDLLDYLDEN